MRKGIILIVGFMLVLICLSISIGYNDIYQRRKRYPYCKIELGKNIKSIIWLGIGTIIVFLTKLLLDYIG